MGDGIVRLAPGDEPALLAAAREAAARGALAKFVPASGAATRMFTGLLALAADPDAEGGRREAAAVGTSLARLALRDRLATLLAPRGETAAALAADPVRLARAIVGADGLDLAALPKGLLPFHLYPEGERTAFVEHLVEGAAYLADREGLCRFDFTVPPGTDPLFHAALAEAGGATAFQRPFEVRLSHQERATDALSLGGTPFSSG